MLTPLGACMGTLAHAVLRPRPGLHHSQLPVPVSHFALFFHAIVGSGSGASVSGGPGWPTVGNSA
eukprot:5612170-Heterocapsa_arctica.AAC.1